MASNYEKINTDENIPALIKYLSKETMLKRGYFTEEPYIPPHWHRSVELSLVEKGEVYLWVNGEKQIIREHEFILVNSGFVHELTKSKEKETSVILVILPYEFLKSCIPNLDHLSFDLSRSPQQVLRLYEIYESFKAYDIDPQPFDSIRITSLLYELVYLLARYFAIQDSETQKKYKKIHSRQRAILDYIEEHYFEDITLDTMSKQFHMSMEHFSRSFYKDFGVHFKAYLDSYRVYQAYQDVVYSGQTMQQIALHHGFSNVKSFINQFKATYAMTPFQYRKVTNIKK